MIETLERTRLTLNNIRTDGGTQSREELNASHLAELVEVLQDGGTFKDPIILFYDGASYWLADGFHRYYAALQARVSNIPIEVRQGTQEDAVEYSCGANATHGLKRSNDDKRRAVTRLLSLPKWQERSNRDIARQCGVTEFLVRTIKGDAIKSQKPVEQPVEPVQEVEQPRLKRTSNEEKRQTVETYIANTPDWEQLSNRAIARICGVSESLVRTIRDERTPEPAQEGYQETIPGQQAIEEIIEPTLPKVDEPILELVYEQDEFSQDFPPDIAPEEVQTEEVLIEEEEKPEPAPAPVAKSAALNALQSSKSNEWYTPARYIYAARELMGGIDTDPASNALANEVIQATTYYDIETNGLERQWEGRVWLNPPYGFTDGRSNQEVWVNRLIEQFKAGITTEAVLLVNANIEAKWFQPLYDYLICQTDHRIHFYNTDDESNQPTQGNAFVYFGTQRNRFIELFSRFGTVIERAKIDERE